MKKSALIFSLVILAFAGMSFLSGPSAPHGDGGSGIHWKGSKVSGSHIGSLSFSEVNMDFTDEKVLRAASFVVDMKSMACSDLEKGPAQKLIGHLMSDDFFGVAEYPTSTFESTKVTMADKGQYEITGELTIKDVTQSISFPAEIIEEGGIMHAAARLDIDRTKFGVKYGSGSFFDNLGDRMIKDEFTIDVHLETEIK